MVSYYGANHKADSSARITKTILSWQGIIINTLIISTLHALQSDLQPELPGPLFYCQQDKAQKAVLISANS